MNSFQFQAAKIRLNNYSHNTNVYLFFTNSPENVLSEVTI